ncbi:hypothetical protein P8C59_006344 [Phyllachora maydis]|uniref:ERCC4 domain-containing protein n=1 Tax=Phyllachora maydis TaxID=1825666 RepID=A0AAD9I6B4_9PEZI|nr:hypothetical protein P8C59_006344 [Phyllachora maydis]
MIRLGVRTLGLLLLDVVELKEKGVKLAQAALPFNHLLQPVDLPLHKLCVLVRFGKPLFQFRDRSAIFIGRSASTAQLAAHAQKIEEKAKKAAERGAEKERKKAEREAAKQEKTMEKERKAALDEVNKLKTDKRKSALEMIVSLPNSLEPKTLARADALLEALHVQFDRWTSPVKNVVTWRRKVKARYVEESDQWEPIPQRIVQERIAMVILPAAEFVQLALGHGSQEEAASGIGDLDTHVDHMRQHFPEHTIIYLIEGLRLWVRNNNNVRNRKFVAAVRNGLDPNSAVNSAASTQPANAPPASSQSRPRQRKKVAPPSEFISEDVIEDALLSLQVLHGARIHHTANHAETAEWVTVFTQHIGTIPYRRQREAISAQGNFCMESGQVRTGDGARDTYVRMLQEVARVTASVAYGIAAEFETVSALVRGLEAEGPLRLQMIRKSANRDGSVTDQRIGPAISKRLHKIFTGRDVDSMDI